MKRKHLRFIGITLSFGPSGAPWQSTQTLQHNPPPGNVSAVTMACDKLNAGRPE